MTSQPTHPDYRNGSRFVRRPERVRRFRREMTDAEQRLWRNLRGGQLHGLKWLRQHEFGPYVLDFYCPDRRLAVEADGGQHLTPGGLARDTARSSFLGVAGITVLRFSNLDVLTNTEGVIQAILRATSPHPNRLPEGEGERLAEDGGR